MKQRTLRFGLAYVWRMVLCGCFVAAVTTSCVDDVYDLDKEISTEVNVFGGLVLPIGTIDSILLSDLLNTDSMDMLSLIDGIYAISMKDTMDMSIDLMDEGTQISIEIDSVKEQVEQSISSDTSFPSFSIGVEQTTTVNMGLSKIALSDGLAVDAGTDLIPKSLDGVKTAVNMAQSGTDVGGFDMEIELDPVEEPIKIEVDCPDVVESIKNIKFGATGDGVDLTITFDISSFADIFGDFVWKTPTVMLYFPAGFLLENGSSSVIFAPQEVSGSGFCEMKTKIMSYESLERDLNGDMPNIEGDIICDVDGDIEIVEAVTKGVMMDSDIKFSLDVATDGAISIYDFDIALSGIEFDIEVGDMSNETQIDDISENIESVEYVQFADGTKALNISIDQLELPTGLAVDKVETMQLGFPKKRFVISESTSDDDDNYYVDIKTSDLIGTGSFTHTVYIDQITLSDCEIDDKGTMVVDPGISMSSATISLAGELSYSTYSSYIETSNEQTIDISAKSGDLEVEYAELVITAIPIELTEQGSSTSISEAIPSELVELYTLEFQDKVTATFKIDITGLPTGGDEVGDLKFDSYTISFPDFIKFAEGDLNDDNELVLDGVVIGDKEATTRSFSRELEIVMMDFTEEDDLITIGADGNTYLNLDVDVMMSGSMLLEGGSVSSDVSKIICDVEFVISPLNVGVVSGKVAPEMPEISQSVDLSDLTSMMSMGEATVVLSNPSITLTVDNSLSLGLELSTLKLVPYKNGVALDAIQTTKSIELAAADADSGESVETVIVLSAYDSNAAGHYQVVGLENLLQTLPDSLQIEVEAGLVDGVHTLDLSKTSYGLLLMYDVNVPLEFDELLIEYADTLGGLSSTLGSVVEMVSNLELQLEITNTFPFSIEVASMTALDSLGGVLDLPDMFPSDNKIGGSTDGVAVVSQFDIRLSDNDAGDLALLDGLLFNVKAGIESTGEAAALKDDQYIQIGVKVSLPDGLTFDIDELLNGEAEDDEDDSMF